MFEISEKMTPGANFKALKGIYAEKWQLLFNLANLGDLDKPLTPRRLSNPYDPLTKLLLYIYSMESFVYQDLNQACRLKDTTKI